MGRDRNPRGLERRLGANPLESERDFIARSRLPRFGSRVAFDRRRFYQVVAILAAVCAYATIVLGGTVRGMDAGLACTDWPLCNGSIVPNLGDPRVAVEYAHRLVAAVTSLSILLTMVLALLWYRAELRLVLLSMVAFGILVAQVGLGALTITSALNWVIVTIHLALGTATFAFGLLVALFALRMPSMGTATPLPVE